MQSDGLGFKYGRLWIGESATKWRFIPSNYLGYSFSAGTSRSNSSKTLCVRLAMPGLGQPFGILGADLAPDVSGNTCVKIGFRDEPSDSSSIQPGLSRELAEAVGMQVEKVLSEDNFLGSGTLIVNMGQYHIVDSGPQMFRLLTACLLRLFDSTMDVIDADSLAALVRRELDALRNT